MLCLSCIVWITIGAWFTSADEVRAQSARTPSQSATPTSVSPKTPARYAIFWSEGSTWIIDTVGGVLFRAPTWLWMNTEGHILEYKLNVHVERLSAQRPFGHVYRWVSFDRYLLNGQHKDQLTYHFSPDELNQETHDEHQVLQFTGDYVTLIRWFYHEHSSTQKSKDITIYTLALNGVQSLPMLKSADQLVKFTRRLYPKLLPTCLKADTRMIRWEIGGQREILWITLSPSSPQIECPQELSALRLSPVPPRRSGARLSWRGETLYHDAEPIYGGVVDALIDPEGQVAVTLEGAPRRDERLLINEVNHLYEKSLRRYLSIWRAYPNPDGDLGRHISFPDGVPIRRLDGARWLSNQSPILKLLDTHFSAVSQSCFKSLAIKSTRKYRAPKRPTAQGHLCAIQTQGRVWEGHHDLSASLAAQMTSDLVHIDLWVNDPDRTDGDVVRVWVGPSEDPVSIILTPRGVIGQRAIQSGVKLVGWWEQRSSRGASINPSAEDVGGYRIRLKLPRSLVRGHLSLAVDDQDLSFPSASQRLWIVGQPRSEAVGDTNLPPEPQRFNLP